MSAFKLSDGLILMERRWLLFCLNSWRKSI